MSFKSKFIDLCNEHNVSPTSVCRAVRISPATFSGWDSNSIPYEATRRRIADYFGMTLEELDNYGEEENAIRTDDVSPEKQKLLDVINACPENKIALLSRTILAILADDD